MIFRRSILPAIVVVVLCAGGLPPASVTEARAQARDPMGPPQPPPPPLPPSSDRDRDDDDWKGDEAPEDTVGRGPLDDDFLPDFEGDWGLPSELMDELARMSSVYETRQTGFTAVETARSAKYDGGEAGDEKVRTYSYILRKTDEVATVAEVRNNIGKGGQLGAPVDDKERFPPAYAWIYLFHEFNQPFFSYRLLGDRFEGFDWVRVIQFRGSLPFTDGRDIRQWEGVVLVDAVTNTPVQIRSQPASQVERLRQQFEIWNKSFNVAGFRTGPRPFGYRCEVEFHERRTGLTFPSRLRYDTYRVVGPRRVVPWSASSRFYTDYRLFGVETEESVDKPSASGSGAS